HNAQLDAQGNPVKDLTGASSEATSPALRRWRSAPAGTPNIRQTFGTEYQAFTADKGVNEKAESSNAMSRSIMSIQVQCGGREIGSVAAQFEVRLSKKHTDACGD